MNERSDHAGIVVAVGVALMLVVLLLVGGGLAFFVFARQAAMVRAEAAMARAAEAQARENLAQAQRAVAAADVAQEKLAEKPTSSPEDQAMSAAIEGVLTAQQQAWNAGNIDQFMEHYWKSDQLTFSSGGQTTRGWDATLKRYRERYATPEKMGKLAFDKLEITPLGDSAALVLGQWHVEREAEPLTGNFSLIVRKIGDRWFIIHDHTSRLVEQAP